MTSPGLRYRGGVLPRPTPGGAVGDAPEMPGIAERDDRNATLRGLVDAEANGLRADRLAEAEVAVDHRHDVVLHDLRDRLIGHDLALAHAVHIARHANHTMAVVSGKVGLDKIVGDARAFSTEHPDAAKISPTKPRRGSA